MTEEEKTTLYKAILTYIQSAQKEQSPEKLQALFVQIKDLFSKCSNIIDKQNILNTVFQNPLSFSELQPNTAKFLVQKLALFYSQSLSLELLDQYSARLYEHFILKLINKIQAKATKLIVGTLSCMLLLPGPGIIFSVYGFGALQNLADSMRTLGDPDNFCDEFKKQLFNPSTKTELLSSDIELLQQVFGGIVHSGNLFMIKEAIIETIIAIRIPELRLLLLLALQNPDHPLCTIMDIKQNPLGITDPKKDRNSGSRSGVRENIYRTEQEIMNQFQELHPHEEYPYLQPFLYDPEAENNINYDGKIYTQMVPLKISSKEGKNPENQNNLSNNLVQFSSVFTNNNSNIQETTVVSTDPTNPTNQIP